jgi:hypothetical protein
MTNHSSDSIMDPSVDKIAEKGLKSMHEPPSGLSSDMKSAKISQADPSSSTFHAMKSAKSTNKIVLATSLSSSDVSSTIRKPSPATGRVAMVKSTITSKSLSNLSSVSSSNHQDNDSASSSSSANMQESASYKRALLVAESQRQRNLAKMISASSSSSSKPTKLTIETPSKPRFNASSKNATNLISSTPTPIVRSASKSAPSSRLHTPSASKAGTPIGSKTTTPVASRHTTPTSSRHATPAASPYVGRSRANSTTSTESGQSAGVNIPPPVTSLSATKYTAPANASTRSILKTTSSFATPQAASRPTKMMPSSSSRAIDMLTSSQSASKLTAPSSHHTNRPAPFTKTLSTSTRAVTATSSTTTSLANPAKLFALVSIGSTAPPPAVVSTSLTIDTPTTTGSNPLSNQRAVSASAASRRESSLKKLSPKRPAENPFKMLAR